MKVTYYNSNLQKEEYIEILDMEVISEPKSLLLILEGECHEEDGSVTPVAEFFKVVSILRCKLQGVEGVSIACSYIGSEDQTLEVMLVDENGYATTRLVDYEEHVYLSKLLGNKAKSFSEYVLSLKRGEIINQLELPKA